MSQEHVNVSHQQKSRKAEDTNQMATEQDNRSSTWLKKEMQPFVLAIVIVVIGFAMWLVRESMQERVVPSEARYLVAFVISIAVVCMTGLMGGQAVLKGKLPLPLFPEAWNFEGQGAVAIFLIVFISIMLITRPTAPQINAIEDVLQASRQYYQLIADDQCALAWERLSESFRTNRNQNDFIGYESWCKRIDEANIADLQVMALSDSFARVRFTIDFVTVNGVHDLYDPLYLDFSLVDSKWLIIDAQS